MAPSRPKCDRCNQRKYKLVIYKQKEVCRDCFSIMSREPIKVDTDDEYNSALRKHYGVDNG